jgi:hypothetical protein
MTVNVDPLIDVYALDTNQKIMSNVTLSGY